MSGNNVAQLFAPTIPQRRTTGTWQRLVHWLRQSYYVMTTRRQLIEMDTRLLSGIGASRADAITEASRAFWDHGGRDTWS